MHVHGCAVERQEHDNQPWDSDTDEGGYEAGRAGAGAGVVEGATEGGVGWAARGAAGGVPPLSKGVEKEASKDGMPVEEARDSTRAGTEEEDADASVEVEEDTDARVKEVAGGL